MQGEEGRIHLQGDEEDRLLLHQEVVEVEASPSLALAGTLQVPMAQPPGRVLQSTQEVHVVLSSKMQAPLAGSKPQAPCPSPYPPLRGMGSAAAGSRP